jgi:dTDP-4-dehydrorhamnose 3,5-epimerase
MIKGVVITHIDVIDTPGGNVMHGMKKTSAGYAGFGEVYFSQVDKGAIKAWKRHKEMTLNLIVPVGEIRFVLFDDREVSSTQFQEIIISKNNYCRLTVPPMIWMGFQGLSDDRSMLLNVANIVHDVHEVDKRNIEQIEFNWNN